MQRAIIDVPRKLYSQHLRQILRDVLFRDHALSVLTRRELVESPPEFVEELWWYGEAETIELSKPTHVGAIPETVSQKVGTWNIAPPFIAVCENIQLIGPDAVPVSPTNRYLLEGIEGSTDRATDAVVRSLAQGIFPQRRPTNKEFETAVSLAGPWSDQFFHWFVEYLPRVVAVEEYIKDSSTELVYLLPSNPPEWLSRSLELLGITDGQTCHWSGGRANVQRLILPSLWRDTESTASGEGYINSPRGIREVSRRLVGGLSDQARKSDVGERLYISRSGAPTRDVVNERDLRTVFESHDIDVVRPETWSLDEQIATFAAAEFVIGPHGGGLTNAMYASEPKVVEFFGEYTNPCYFGLFSGNGWDYELVDCSAVGQDIRVDPEDVNRICERLLY